MRGALTTCAEERGCELSEEPVWRIEPVAFDPGLVAIAREACEEVTGSGFELASGALHDAAEIAAHVPTAMIFSRSAGGISHNPDEDTAEADLRAAIGAFGLLARRCSVSGFAIKRVASQHETGRSFGAPLDYRSALELRPRNATARRLACSEGCRR